MHAAGSIIDGPGNRIGTASPQRTIRQQFFSIYPMPVLQDLTLVSRGLVPVKGHNLNEEIACYSLPYGALGFVSHFLTYYTLACLYAGRSPSGPSGKSNIASLTFASVSNTWQLLVIAVWKLSMSLLNGITAVQVAALVILNDGSRKKSGKAAWWIVLCLTILFNYYCHESDALFRYPWDARRHSRLMSLVIQNAQGSAVMKLTIGFYCIVGFGVAIFALGLCMNLTKEKKKPDPNSKQSSDDDGELFLWGMGGFAFSLTTFTILAAFYCDWALGMMTHNLIGLPSGDHSGFYWTYFFAKRLTMLSW
ncbi:hypothetical protein BD779DRAFT_1669928 [Infundibulicybe gibba]|nr:hypothetical protein BD779DRAFT_1669928 [Infundibulicybe gibba]